MSYLMQNLALFWMIGCKIMFLLQITMIVVIFYNNTSRYRSIRMIITI